MAGETGERVVLIVDDNRMYREAMARNLRFAGYTVLEAGGRPEALESVARKSPHVVITDLDMQTRTDGLELIRELKASYPWIPVIMISAVGTFDEGALAQQFGAIQVLSKSRIDEEIGTLYQTLERIYATFESLRRLQEQVEAAGEGGASPELRESLRALLSRTDVDVGVKSVVFDLLAQLDRPAAVVEAADGFTDEALEQAEAGLRTLVPELDRLHVETRAMLRTAEVMFASQREGAQEALSRNMGFSYSFAVENEVKQGLGRKFGRFIGQPDLQSHISQLYDTTLGSLELGFNQYVLRLSGQIGPELNPDIIRQVLERMRQHGPRYKPDGLKALGVLVFCFGREYTFRGLKATVRIANPLSLRGIEDDEACRFAYSLVLLQHLRNPYIHPEFTEREKIDRIRETAIACLNDIVHVN